MQFLNSAKSDLAGRISEESQESVEPFFQYKSELALVADGRLLGSGATRRNVSRSNVEKASPRSGSVRSGSLNERLVLTL